MKPFLLMLLMIALGGALPAQDAAEAPKPIDRTGLIEALRLGGLSPQELIGIIRDIGVDFQLQPADEKEFKALGATPALLEAVRANFRAEEPEAPVPNIELPEGPPLNKAQVVLLLQGGVAPPLVVELIKKRGAAFALDRAGADQILAAGGNKLVVGAIVVNQRDVAPAPAAASPAPTAAVAPAKPAAAPGKPPVLEVPAAEQAKKIIRQNAPDYPVLAARMGLSGKVVLDVRIAPNGEVASVRPVSGHSMLSASAVSAVRTWLYEPTLVNGIPAEVHTEVEVNFTLKK
jgi:TonB family protein